MRLSLLLLFVLFVFAPPAMAQTAIHHCIGRNGNPVFTDQPCATMQASPVSPSAAAGDAAQSTPPMLCAATRDDLRQAVIDAFAHQDANRLAGLMLWGGYGHGAAIADIHALAGLVRQPLLDVGFPHDPPPELPYDGTALAPLPYPPSASTRLVLHTAGHAGSGFPREQRFVLVRRAGCLWLRNAD